MLSEDVWQGKVRGYRLSATCVHFDARANRTLAVYTTATQIGTSVAKSFAVRFAAGARLSSSGIAISFSRFIYVTLQFVLFTRKLHDLNRACYLVRRVRGALAGARGGVRLSTPRVLLRVRRRAPTSHIAWRRTSAPIGLHEYESECKKIETTGLTNLWQQ